MQQRILFPFTAIVNLNKLKLAMIVNAINPNIGGLLISGPKGSGKTTAVRALRDVLPKIKVVKACPFNCNPNDSTNMCERCNTALQKGESLGVEEREMRVVDLPLGATEDRVIGSIDIQKAIKHGVGALEPGILAEANQNILYVDEINLLPDYIADDLLDAAATGWNVVEREGISVSHPSRFIFIGTMNPEEGQLRPQLLDRFPLSVAVSKITSVEERMEVVKRNLKFQENPESLNGEFQEAQEELKEKIQEARILLPKVDIPEKLLEAICETCLSLKVDGLRPDIVISRVAITLSAFEGRSEVGLKDALLASELALSHRTREGGFLEPATPEEISKTLLAAAKAVGYKPEKKEEVANRKKSAESDGKKKEGRAFTFVKGNASKKLEDLLKKDKALSERLKRISQFFVNLNRILSQVIIAFGSRIKSKINNIPSVKAVTKSDKPLRADPGKEGKQVSLKKVKGKPKISYSFKTQKAKKGFSLFRIFKGSTKDSQLLSKLSLKANRVSKITTGVSGRRAEATTSSRGRARGWKVPKGKPRDVHMPATIRAAAIKQQRRKRTQKVNINIALEDVREKLRRHKAPMTIIFVLDLSGSMLLRIDAIKKAILKLHGDAYRYRDRVGIVALKDMGAIVAQHPITNLRVVANKLMKLKISGYTPLASGMLKAWEVLKESKRRDPSTIPVMILISDGGANVPLVRSLETGKIRNFNEERIIVRDFEGIAVHDVISVSKMIEREGIHTIVINTNPHIMGRETYGSIVTEMITANTHGKLHSVGRLQTEPELVESVMEKIVKDQRLIAFESSKDFD